MERKRSPNWDFASKLLHFWPWTASQRSTPGDSQGMPPLESWNLGIRDILDTYNLRRSVNCQTQASYHINSSQSLSPLCYERFALWVHSRKVTSTVSNSLLPGCLTTNFKDLWSLAIRSLLWLFLSSSQPETQASSRVHCILKKFTTAFRKWVLVTFYNSFEIDVLVISHAPGSKHS